MAQNPFKETFRKQKMFANRLIFAAIIGCILLLTLVCRLFFLQVIDHEQYTTLSQKNQLSLIPIEPTRGIIYDRNGVLIAENIPTYNLEIVPDKVSNLSETLANIQKILPSITQEDLQTFAKQKRQHSSFDSIPLKMHLTPEEVAQFSVQQYQFPGVSVEARLMRHYPLGPLMAHVLGYVGRINESEWKTLDPINYSATHFIGKIGIERHYEKQLHGTVGYKRVETNASGRQVRTLNTEPSVSGKNLYLTIDSRLQKAADDALGTRRGVVILMNPNNGELLAMVSKPTYDSNFFAQGIDTKTFQSLMKNPEQPLYNRAIRGQYPLASTIKPYIALAALNDNKISMDSKVFDPGYFQLPNSTHHYRDWAFHRGGRGYINVTNAIAYSSDTYFFTVGYSLGIHAIDDFMARFGFGSKTGLDLDEELAGLLPTPEWKRRVKHAAWFPGDTVVASIGQGYWLATPMQLAFAVSTLSQHGIRFTPHLVKTSVPEMKTPIILNNPENWDNVIKAMQTVITNPHGTGRLAWHSFPYSVAAKTGTAQVFTVKQNEDTHNDHLPEYLRDHSLVIAFFPVEKPEVTITVLAENNHDASLIGRQVLDAYAALHQDSISQYKH